MVRTLPAIGILLTLLLHFACGIPSDFVIPSIVGGMDVPKGKFVPYQVSLQYRQWFGRHRHFCGGSIISATHILTAAHCLINEMEKVSIVAGIRDLRDSGQRSAVVSYELHENYQELVTSDIAILRISPPLKLDGVRVAAINVSGTQYVEGDVSVTLTGWGLRLPLAVPFLPPLLQTINYPTTLQTMTYRTITNEQCRAKGMVKVTETEICAMGFGRAACGGDSGGPLVMSTKNGLLQVGIVSYGFVVCLGPLAPDVYTRVSTFNDWIQQRLK